MYIRLNEKYFFTINLRIFKPKWQYQYIKKNGSCLIIKVDKLDS